LGGIHLDARRIGKATETVQLALGLEPVREGVAVAAGAA